jgi:hypothetical protein
VKVEFFHIIEAASSLLGASRHATAPITGTHIKTAQKPKKKQNHLRPISGQFNALEMKKRVELNPSPWYHLLKSARTRGFSMHTARTRRKVRSKKQEFRRRLTYLLVAIAASALVVFLVYSTLGPKTAVDRTPKIAIVDQLSAQWPDPAFTQTIQGILNQTGLKVDYYPSEDVTVDFYRNLPSHNYRLIIFRVHSTSETGAEDMPPWVVFFTSENYSNTAHVSEQLDMRVVYVKFPDVTQLYFGITPTFVQNSMEGRFNGTTVVAMGCEGLNQTTMAEAFIQKGAKSFISYDGSVSENYTDNATVCLLRHLVTENQTIQEAVAQTMNEVGPDPQFKSVLKFYPANAGSNLLLLNATIATPTVTTARKNTSENDENSETTLVPSILTS